ncbi:MAG: TIGR02452 family protein, partial [Clostridium sp.]|nr:TIGR02452 family protein [Clostridium sp.]
MDRKAIARETLEIMKRGTYEAHGTTIDIIKQHRASVDNSLLFTPEQA